VPPPPPPPPPPAPGEPLPPPLRFASLFGPSDGHFQEPLFLEAAAAAAAAEPPPPPTPVALRLACRAALDAACAAAAEAALAGSAEGPPELFLLLGEAAADGGAPTARAMQRWLGDGDEPLRRLPAGAVGWAALVVGTGPLLPAGGVAEGDGDGLMLVVDALRGAGGRHSLELFELRSGRALGWQWAQA